MSYHHGDLPQALLDAVDEIITEGGVESLSLRAVARHAGVSHGAPAHHFGDKRGLLSAYAERAARSLESCVLDALRDVAPDDHVERLTRVGMGYVEFALSFPAQFEVCFRREWLDLSNEALQLARASAGDTLVDVLSAARDGGALAPADFDAIRMASWSMAHGFSCLVVDNALPVSEPEALRHIAYQAFRTYSEAVFAAK